MSQKVWHVSRGVVFAGGGDRRVVYPRLAPARIHSSPAALSSQDEVRKTIEDLATDSTPVAGDVTAAPTEEAKEEGEETVSKPVVVDPATLKPPYTPLEFKIPENAFRAAKLAAEGTSESFWSYILYRGPPSQENGPGSKVKVHYCTSKHTTERVLQQYFKDEEVLGFDLEWAADARKTQGPRKNISLIQLASPSRIALFHVALFPKNDELVAPTLKKIMEDPDITKTGVWIKGDCTRLRNFLGIDSRGIFELSHLYKLVKYSSSGEFGLLNKRLVSLSQQVKECLQLPLFKGQDVRTSDWSQPLRMGQLIYSASDAYAAVQLYATLDHQRQKLDPTPPLPYHAELNLPIRVAEGVVLQTADEPLEPEAEEEAAAKEDGPELSAEYLSSVGDSISLEPENDSNEEANGAFSKSASPGTTPTFENKSPPTLREETSPASPKDSRIEAAEKWVAEYRATQTRKPRVGPSALRAYRLWDKNCDLEPVKIASLLRDPPLQTPTVVGYISDAVRAEGLPFDKERMRAEVLSLLSDDLQRHWRFRYLVEACSSAEPKAKEKATAAGE
ncbi:exonuclease [Podospora didyma]|uniref:Exonuclease n=1 Tax=Podospora didyma TaxID=330526 RepID=A0AAE0NCN0_9PEZI|nr:exonuclease [Podospora didyma]